MGSTHRIGGHTFDYRCNMVDVTSMSRPDTDWRFTDKEGHLHHWFINGVIPEQYRPDNKYQLDSLVWVKDGEEYWEDDSEPHDVGHHECRWCGEHITPRYRADDHTQYIAGLQHYRIDGVTVDKDEFMQRLEQARTAALNRGVPPASGA